MPLAASIPFRASWVQTPPPHTHIRAPLIVSLTSTNPHHTHTIVPLPGFAAGAIPALPTRNPRAIMLSALGSAGLMGSLEAAGSFFGGGGGGGGGH